MLEEVVDPISFVAVCSVVKLTVLVGLVFVQTADTVGVPVGVGVELLDKVCKLVEVKFSLGKILIDPLRVREDTQRDIFLFDLYNSAPTLPTDQKKFDTKFGVISHETSHEAIKTKDHYYGYKKYHKDANVCATDITFTNADCVQFFTESAFIVLGQDNSVSDEEL